MEEAGAIAPAHFRAPSSGLFTNLIRRLNIVPASKPIPQPGFARRRLIDDNSLNKKPFLASTT